MQKLRAWLQLFRAPNLFTVPGDPLAGFLLANFGVLTLDALPVIAASLCFYAAGLLDNDLADLAEDRAERPSRPLPSGAAHAGVVSVVVVVLCFLGLTACAALGTLVFKIGIGIVASVLFYNRATKRLPVIGALNMGLCRALSLLLGAAAAPSRIIPDEAITAAIVTGLFIAAITHLARFETKRATPFAAKWLPSAVLLAGLAFTLNWERIGRPADAFIGAIAMRAILALALLFSALVAWKLTRDPTVPVPPAIGRFIRLMLFLQAAWCAHTGGMGLIFASLLLAMWPISRAVSRRFYAS